MDVEESKENDTGELPYKYENFSSILLKNNVIKNFNCRKNEDQANLNIQFSDGTSVKKNVNSREGKRKKTKRTRMVKSGHNDILYFPIIRIKKGYHIRNIIRNTFNPLKKSVKRKIYTIEKIQTRIQLLTKIEQLNINTRSKKRNTNLDKLLRLNNNSKLLYNLINNIYRYINFELVIDRKRCYQCFLLKHDKTNKYPTKLISLYKYLQIVKKKKNKKIISQIDTYTNDCKTGKKNYFIFNYGFYTKKGIYHENEDTSSHVMLSSYKIYNEINKLINLINARNKNRNIKYNILDDVLKLLKYSNNHNNESKSSDTNSNEYYEENQWGNKNSKNMFHSKADDKIYLKFASPTYYLMENAYNNAEEEKYDMICNYFFYGLNNNKKNNKKCIMRRQNKKNKISDFDPYKLNVINYGIEKSQMLESDQEEQNYYTFNENLKKCPNIQFICKVCKKCEYIKSKDRYNFYYFSYLFKNLNSGKINKNNERFFSNGVCANNNVSMHCSNNKRTIDQEKIELFSDSVRKNMNCSGKNENIEEKEKEENKIKNKNHDDVTYKLMSEEFTLNDYIIKCKTCRHFRMYDNLPNKYFTDIFFNIPGSLKCQNFMNEPGKSIFYNIPKIRDQNNNEIGYIKNSKTNEYKSNYCIKNVRNNNLFKWVVPHSYTDVEFYEKESNIYFLYNKNKAYTTNKHINILSFSQQDDCLNDQSEKEMDITFSSLMSLKKQKKEYFDSKKRKMFVNYYKSTIKRNSENKEDEEKYDKDDNRNIFKKAFSQFDMHLFTICDGHTDSNGSTFLIQNVHKLFYYLLIYTFFNIHLSLKILHPLLDILYYKYRSDNNLTDYSGSCIINVLLRKNNIYVNNTGDSKCAIMTFDLSKFGYGKSMNNTLKEEKSKKNKKNKKMKNTDEAYELGKENKNDFKENNIFSELSNIRESSYKHYIINEESISYNELNSEHNCNNYMEYLRMYKLNYCDNLKKDYLVSNMEKNLENLNKKVENIECAKKELDKEKFTTTDYQIGGKDNEEVPNISQVINVSKRKKGKKGKGKKENLSISYDLNDLIIKINKYILKEDGKEIDIANVPFELIKFNRLYDSLHPSRVIGDYDLKGKCIDRDFILSNNSNIYKYDMNNINWLNNIHYIYKIQKCINCKMIYLLNSYGKVNSIQNISLLNMKNKLHQNSNTLVNYIEKNIKNNYCNNVIDESDSDNSFEKKLKSIISIYKDNENSDSKKMKTKNTNLYLNDNISRYIHIKNNSLNTNYVYQLGKKENKHFFHLLIIASDGVFEYLNPAYVLNIIKNNKPIYKKIQKIYYIYNMYSTNRDLTNRDINYMLHTCMFTKKECTQLAKNIIKKTVNSGNIDDSTCFCIFLFPTMFFHD
ncbi:conserved Plasmodium protein, unknown function [Plasmodium vinckei vinckei]|uniref:PPM-type phosphatase domain-containing protein n=1 Tax=Plasmodium vinckei vinckei TaxID=54757 RepID=A0A449BWR7_PLAVN|nr:conserved Plasmodium protein, unknown function [Plasmodium vinckei vinckei]KEG03622.1 hypothetical protein YYE_01646 [Plasmodium vinckei vinckei]VEV57917.1 conserved Plasmodium protein, unknown function [Plasmodium vinckei vinckei]